MTPRRWIVTTTLNNNLLKAKLPPLLAAFPELEIILVTDRPGAPLDRVRYVYPSKLATKLFGRLLPRYLLLWREAARSSVERIMVYNTVPHLLLAKGPARWFGKSLDLHMIAGTLELDFADRQQMSGNHIIRSMRNPHAFQRYIRRRVLRRVDRYFVPGENVTDFLKELGVPSNRIHKIHSSIDVHFYSPGGSPRDIDVLIVANLQTRKRPFLTIEILEQVLAKRPEARFAWIGDGFIRDEVLAAVKKSSLGDSVEMIGHTDDVLSYMRRAKTFLLNSTSEGLSCATMEAMAAGVVPVVTDVGAMNEIVRANDTGAVFDIDAPASDYSRSILELLSDNSEREQFAAASRELIVCEHSYEAIIAAWHNLQ